MWISKRQYVDKIIKLEHGVEELRRELWWHKYPNGKVEKQYGCSFTTSWRSIIYSPDPDTTERITNEGNSVYKYQIKHDGKTTYIKLFASCITAETQSLFAYQNGVVIEISADISMDNPDAEGTL